MNTTSKIFTKDELKLLHSVVRHEMPQQEMWKFPPASLELNDQLAEVLLFCEENDAREAALQLSRGDCLVIDYYVRDGMKSPAGVNYGWNILLKVFAARRDLAGGPIATVQDAETPDIPEKMTEWEQTVAAVLDKPKRRNRRSA